MDLFSWVQNWYEKNCNGDWEHSYGIKIETVDNPGWYVEIDLTETYLEDKHFNSIKIERNEDDWFYCAVRERQFVCAGGAKNLIEILSIF
ncbi:immunity 53 family protein [Paenibacillus sp. YAF4_2]|uniref:immunity 53 family protein n=1 Tax=Paenibacillus sp. YAF4_2 TaxID=3233085 RepID=UPI003F970C11